MSSKYAKEQPEGFTNRIERVAIVGVGGQIGSVITKALLDTGKHTVTAITRVGSTNKVPEGVKAAEVDYDNEDSLVSALTGQQALAISLSVRSPPDTEAKLIAAAAKAGVSWIIPNGWGIDVASPQFLKDIGLTTLLSSTDAIEKAGVSSWTTMVSSFWYEYSLANGPEWYGFDFANKKVTMYDDGKTAINTSTWDLCGKALARLLSLKELPEDENDKSITLSRWRNKPFRIASFLVSQRDMLDSVNRVSGTTDKDWTIEYEPTEVRYNRGKEILKTGDHRGFALSLYSRTFYPNGDGNFEASHGLDNDALGLLKEDIDEATKRSLGMVERGWNSFTNRGAAH